MQDPQPTLGGGVSSGLLGGELNVFVVDAWTDVPIRGARVFVRGEVLETDANGLAVFDGDHLNGPQDVTAWADGYGASTWIGVDGAVTTIPLRLPYEPEDALTATVSGTIEGWGDLPDAPTDHHIDVWLGPSFAAVPGGIRNGVLVCSTDSPSNDPCEWMMETRTGRQALLAAIVDVDTRGTPQESDDWHLLMGYAIARGLDLNEGEVADGVVLSRVPDEDVVDLTATFAALEWPMESAAWLAALDLGEEGLLALSEAPAGTSVDVPRIAGPLADASYLVMAVATSESSTPPAYTGVLVDSDARADRVNDLGQWLDVPGAAGIEDRTVEFEPVAAAALHSILLSGGAGVEWDVMILDGTGSFTLPAVEPDPLPPALFMISVEAREIADFDPTDFSLGGLLWADQRKSMALDFPFF